MYLELWLADVEDERLRASLAMSWPIGLFLGRDDASWLSEASGLSSQGSSKPAAALSSVSCPLALRVSWRSNHFASFFSASKQWGMANGLFSKALYREIAAAIYVNVRGKVESKQTFTKFNETSNKGLLGWFKTNLKRSKIKDQELVKKSTKIGMNLGFSPRSSLWCLSDKHKRISPQMYSLKLQPRIPQKNSSPKGLKHKRKVGSTSAKQKWTWNPKNLAPKASYPLIYRPLDPLQRPKYP
jgi:hypothetical protein